MAGIAGLQAAFTLRMGKYHCRDDRRMVSCSGAMSAGSDFASGVALAHPQPPLQPLRDDCQARLAAQAT